MECRPNGERLVSGPALDVDNEIKHCPFPRTWKQCKTREEEQEVKVNDFRLFLTLMYKKVCVNGGFSDVGCNK